MLSSLTYSEVRKLKWESLGTGENSGIRACFFNAIRFGHVCAGKSQLRHRRLVLECIAVFWHEFEAKPSQTADHLLRVRAEGFFPESPELFVIITILIYTAITSTMTMTVSITTLRKVEAPNSDLSSLAACFLAGDHCRADESRGAAPDL